MSYCIFCNGSPLFCVYNKNNRLLCSRITDGIMLIINKLTKTIN
nr:MAG TPA: hypothetical protein [Caudoviricetes sp.]